MTSPRSRILAVDDDPVNLSVLEELLADEYELKTLMDHTRQQLAGDRADRAGPSRAPASITWRQRGAGHDDP